jgi:transglutaminase-like putative cysteine protease
MGILYTHLPRQGIFWLVTALGAALLLIGITYYEERQRTWQREGVPWEDSIWQRALWLLLGISSVVMIAAAAAPSVYLKEITGPIQEWLWKEESEESVFQDLLGFESDEEEDLSQVLRRFGLPRQHLIGLQEELSQKVVMVVRFPPGTPSQEDLPPLAFYWRSFTFDFYTGSGWATGTTMTEEYSPALNYHTYPLEYYQTIRQEIRVIDDLRGTLYSPGIPLSVDRESLVFWRRTGEDQGSFKSILTDDIYAVTINNPVYQVYSVLPVIDEQALRDASPFYSGWVEDRYLQLPENIPQRVYDLADELVENQYTPYDEARAIEDYVSSFPYTLDLPEPPYDQDIADYFLFELQKGYCDYYATSMAVLARAVGLPARVVIGYSGAYYDQPDDRYLVTEADAHTWVEIYFPEVGWIPFEPTAGRSNLEAKSQEEPGVVPPELDKPAQTFGPRTGFYWPDFLRRAIFPGVILLLTAVMGGIYWLDLIQLKRGSPSVIMLRIYQRLINWGNRLDVELPDAATPYEYEAILMARVAQYQWYTGHRYGIIPGPEQLSPVIDGFVKDRYEPVPITAAEAGEMVSLWQRIRIALFSAWIIYKRIKLADQIRNWKVFVWLREIWRRL